MKKINLINRLKEKETKIMYWLKSKYSSEKIEKMEKTLRGVCSFLIFVNVCTVMLHIEVLANDIETILNDNNDLLTVVVSKEDIETITTDTIDDFSNELDTLSVDDNLESNESNLYVTKRLIVLSNTDEFETYKANSIVNYGNLYVLQFETEKDTEYAYKKLKKTDVIESVEIDTVMESGSDNVNDNELNTSEKDTELKKYLDTKEVVNEIKVAILDTGVDVKNDVLKDRIIDLGINLSSTGDKNSISDDNGHGTEIATLIANNSNSNVKLMPIKVANENGKATILNTYLGIQKAIENNANVINISMNTAKSTTSQILENVINEASDKGIVVVVSAGNNGMNTEDITPSNIESAIVVSAVDNNNFASYSNYGATVDFTSYGIYENKSGTSYAAANVSGIIGDLLSKNEQVSILNNYAIDLGDTGFDNYFGNGLVAGYLYESNSVNDSVIDDIVTDGKVDEVIDDGELSVSADDYNIYSEDRFDVEYSSGYIRNKGAASYKRKKSNNKGWK